MKTVGPNISAESEIRDPNMQNKNEGMLSKASQTQGQLISLDDENMVAYIKPRTVEVPTIQFTDNNIEDHNTEAQA